MKGQFFAVETVLTFALGIIVAIGVIVIFHQYRLGAMERVESDQADIVHSRVFLEMEQLKGFDEKGKLGSASIDFVLPDEISGEDYSISLGDNLTIFVRGSRYAMPVHGFQNYSLDGEATGGDVTVFKEQDQIKLRDR